MSVSAWLTVYVYLGSVGIALVGLVLGWMVHSEVRAARRRREGLFTEEAPLEGEAR